MDRTKLTAGSTPFPTDSSVSRRDTGNSNKNFHLIWLAEDGNELKKKFPQAINYLQNIFDSIEFFVDSNHFVESLYETNHKDKKIYMIVSGGVGKNTVPAVHDVTELDSIYVFCYNRAHHEQWTKAYMKVKGVFIDIDDLSQAIGQSKQNRDDSSMRVTPVPSKPLIAAHNTSKSQTPSSRDSQHQRTTEIGHQHAYTSDSAENEEDRRAAITIIEGDQHENHRRHRKRTDSPTVSLKNDKSQDFSLINSLKSTITSQMNLEQSLSPNFEQFERTLIAKTEQTLRHSLLGNRDINPLTSINAGTIDRLQDTLLQTMRKNVTEKSVNLTEWNKLFGDLKQALVEAVVQQQSELLRDVIKQSICDALIQQSQPVLTPALHSTTADSKGLRQRKAMIFNNNSEVKIAADIEKTRIDATFRQQRDAVVSNKRLRDVVQQCATIGSMADLAVTIKQNAANDLECAWMLFCWIGQNIQYQPYCNSNSAESVFRTRQGVCRGFVSLYHECCSILAIECSEISGYAKQAFVKSSEDLKQSLHAWNSIILDQYTYLIDPTWGAGGRDNKKKLEDFYFLTSPEELIYTHYVNGYQLLKPEITKQEFISLPVMKSTYYQLGLTLISPKQGLNQTNENLFKIIVRAPINVNLHASLKIGDVEYPSSLHTLCQRDVTQPDIYNCYLAPPLDGIYELSIFAKTNNETTYFEAINMRLRASNITDAFVFPIIYAAFTEHHCLLIEPLQRLLHENEEILIHMIIPNANVIKIRNGDEYMVPHKDEYKNGVLRKQIIVQGDLQVCGRWDDKADSISILCIFNMI